MANSIVTLTSFILREERKNKNARGSLTILLTCIENTAKIIASHVQKSGLIDIEGKTGLTNIFNEEVQKLDEHSNTLMVESLSASGQVYALASEELEKPIFVSKKHAGEYNVFFDPIDGSSNIDTNCPVGTIFSIYHKNKGLLQMGKNQVASGYIIYGSSTMFVYTSGNGVHGFTLDPSIGSFLLSHHNIIIPKNGSIYSINEGNESLFDDSTKKYLLELKIDGKYKARYVGSMVADVHRTLLKGGIFLYPADKKNKEGKLRLMFEVNPMSLLIQEAGGAATSQGINPLSITPTHVHQRIPIALGSKNMVQQFLPFLRSTPA